MSSNLPNPGSTGSYIEKLTIETPEQTSLDFAIAGIGSRFLALAIDTLIQILVGFIVGLGGGMVVAALEATAPKSAVWGMAIMVLFFFLLYFGYFAFFEIIWNGQTPGKRKAGIRVIKDSGRPLTAAESIARNLLPLFDWLTGFYALGKASALTTQEKKTHCDLVAGSLVVRESSFGDLKPVWQTAQVSTVPVSAPLGAAKLTLEESTLIDSFLTRRSELDFDVRTRMAEQILQRPKPNLTLPMDNTSSQAKILESLAYERRATGGYG